MPFVTIRQLVFGVAAAALISGCGAGAEVASPAQQCPLPNVLARILTTAVADEPPIAIQEGIAGPVSVLVSLDAHSAVTNAVVESSPSQIVDASAIRAAQASTYQTAIMNCLPVASSLVFVVRFPVVPLPPPGP